MKIGGGYDRMRNAKRNGAARYDMPFTHGAQAAVWNAIGGTPNPASTHRPDLDLSTLVDPGDLCDEMWARGGPLGGPIPAGAAALPARAAT